jgi:hypothetical protein
MWAGWFIVMNVIQPRLMASAVGIHPIVVFASVIVGLKMAGIVGAIFGIPIAAVISSFFFYYLNRNETLVRDATSRAVNDVEESEERRATVTVTPPVAGATVAGSPAAAPPASREHPEPNPQRP